MRRARSRPPSVGFSTLAGFFALAVLDSLFVTTRIALFVAARPGMFVIVRTSLFGVARPSVFVTTPIPLLVLRRVRLFALALAWWLAGFHRALHS